MVTPLIEVLEAATKRDPELEFQGMAFALVAACSRRRGLCRPTIPSSRRCLM